MKVKQRIIQCTVCQNKKVILDSDEFLDSILVRGKVFCTICLGLQTHIEIEKERKVKV